MKLQLWTLSLLAVIVGFVAGLASVGPASATTTYTIRIMGGALSREDTPQGQNNMTCGWHGSCGDSPTSGVALDWLPNANHAFYFRSFMYKSSGSLSTVAIGTVEVPTGQTCTTVSVHLSDAGGSQTYRGTIIYYHVSSTAGGNTININATTSGYWTQSQVGSTITSGEYQGCPWTGEHLHQRAYWENSTGSRNTGLYPNYVNPGLYYIDRASYYTDTAYWSY